MLGFTCRFPTWRVRRRIKKIQGGYAGSHGGTLIGVAQIYSQTCLKLLDMGSGDSSLGPKFMQVLRAAAFRNTKNKHHVAIS